MFDSSCRGVVSSYRSLVVALCYFASSFDSSFRPPAFRYVTSLLRFVASMFRFVVSLCHLATPFRRCFVSSFRFAVKLTALDWEREKV